MKTRSIKRQIAVLGGLVLFSVAVAMALNWALIGRTEAVRVRESSAALQRAARQLAAGWKNLKAGQHGVEESLLNSAAEAALAGFHGVEGGFFLLPPARLLGYAYPTYQGSGPKSDLPQAEKPAIRQIAEQAAAGGKAVEKRIAAGTDVILFRAEPLADGADGAGAVWVMERLHGIHDFYQKMLTGVSIACLTFVTAIAGLGWLAVERLTAGVSDIADQIRDLGGRMDKPLAFTGISELNRIVDAFNRLSAEVRANQARQAELEERMRHMDKLAALGGLAAGLAHEIRNPLATVKLKLHLLSEQAPMVDAAANHLAIATGEIRRMDGLIDRILQLSKPSAPAASPVCLLPYLHERLAGWRERASARNAALVLRPAQFDGQRTVRLDRDAVSQILDNLIGNALDALQGQAQGFVALEALCGPGEVVLRCTDNGPGISAETAARLFEPFFTTKPGGTGLGLFLAAELARRLGGELVLRRQSVCGAVFELVLPC